MEKNKVKHLLKTGAIDLIVILSSFTYIFFSMVKMELVEDLVIEGVTKAVLGVIVGLLIKQCLGENGFTKGYADDVWTSGMEKYNEVCNYANPYLERVDNFYANEIIEKKKNYRRQNLMAARLKYNDFFDEKGEYIENDIVLTRYQKRVVKKCLRVKIYCLNLFSEYSNAIGADTRREKTDSMQRGLMLGKNSVATIVCSLIGIYILPTLTTWDWAEFIISCVQVCIWISTGIIQLYTNYNYVTIDKIAKLKRKQELIQKFYLGCKKGLYTKNPYDESEVKNEKVEISNISNNELLPTSELSNIEIQPIPSQESLCDIDLADIDISSILGSGGSSNQDIS